MGSYYLAIDIGVLGGRHILGYLMDGKLRLEEIHRFNNCVHEFEGEPCWDYDYLFREIKAGLIKCRELNKLPIFVSIDTWGVSVVLLDGEGNVISNPAPAHDVISQLRAIREKNPEYTEKEEAMLLVPDYFNYLLTGIKRCEYSSADTTQLLSPVTKNWDEDLIKSLGYSSVIFPKLCRPGTILGNLRLEVNEEIGYDLIVVTTASSVADYLRELTAGVTGKTVYPGPEDVLVTGNILGQMMVSHELADLAAAGECILQSQGSTDREVPE